MTKLTLLAAVLLLAVGACGGDSNDGLRIENAWARATPGAATNGAVYMELRSGIEDQLVGASAPAVAATTEIHETVMADDTSDAHGDHGSDTDAGDVAMTMQQVQAISLPAGEDVALEPGGFHVMLIDLVKPLAPGDTFELTLEFAEAGTQVIEIDVLLDRP